MTDPAALETLFQFPQIDPVAFQIGPVVIRWYALAYMAGLLGGWQILRTLAKSAASPVTVAQIDSLLNYILFGVIIGGRVGYVIFYKPLAYLSDPLSIVKLWEGGMSFHGGFLGVIIAVILFAKWQKCPLWPLADRVALVAPIGLFFGRLANFINGELYGRISDHPFAMVFPGAGAAPRHPSQLYEAGLEGLILGLVMLIAWRAKLAERFKGSLVAIFLIGYGTARFVVEFTREPDAHIGLYDFAIIQLSHGQLLCLPMIAAGLIFGLYLGRGKEA